MQPEYTRVISICLFRVDDSILVFEGYDSVKETYYYRPLGGEVHLGETTKEAVVREIREELEQEIIDVHLVGVLENLFVFEGVPGHEIVFVYDGRFADESVYNKTSLTVIEDNGDILEATWRSLDSFDSFHRLVPESMSSLLQK